MLYGHKSSGNKGTESGWKGLRGPSVTKIVIISIKICTQNLFLGNEIQLQSQPTQALTLDLIRGTYENRCSVAKLILRMLISSFSFHYFFFFQSCALVVLFTLQVFTPGSTVFTEYFYSLYLHTGIRF